MSRPSRGFRVVDTRPASGPACPSASVIVFTRTAPNQMRMDVTWTPNVQVGVMSYYLQVDSEDPLLLGNNYDVTSPDELDFDPSDYGAPGQTFKVWCDAQSVDGCPDFTSNQPTLIY